MTNASTLIKGTKIKGTPEKILYAIVNLLLSYETGNVRLKMRKLSLVLMYNYDKYFAERILANCSEYVQPSGVE